MLQPGSPFATATGSLLPIGRTQLLASPDAGPNSALRSWCSSPGTARHGSALFVQPPSPAAASPSVSGGSVVAALLAEPLQGSSRAYRWELQLGCVAVPQGVLLYWLPGLCLVRAGGESGQSAA
jgi:hypothetical protein